ncbi:MAG: endonuclease MutS2 [Chlorobi bacterium]|nr:endonuclease MutS2 [Chlorobiota bacterium]
MIGEKVLEQLEFRKALNYAAKYAVTENGRKIVENLLPQYEKETVALNGSFVSEAKAILIDCGFPPIEYIFDLNETLAQSKIDGAVLNQKQILGVKRLAEISRRIHQFLKNVEGEYKLVKEFAGEFFVNKNFEDQIEKIFTESGEINDRASKTLAETRRKIIEKSDQLRKTIRRKLKELSDSYLVQEEYVTQRDGRIVLPIKAEHKRRIKGFIHSESATGQTVYIEPEETLELNNEILSLRFEEKREIERILREITKRIGALSGELRRAFRAVSEVDSIFARANYSMEIIGAFPSFEESEPLQLIKAYHPVLLKKNGKEKTVPLDLKIDNEKVILITGPNAGGKTVVLKTLGLISLLAQAGMHVPLDPDSNLRLFDSVLIDIGDRQSIEDDLSTFTSHLSNLKEIIKRANDKSLVLLDEIGTGTDPSEGSALAAATLIALKEKNATVLATTHHGNLKIIANETEGFQNASMEFDLENLSPTFRLHQGMPGASYALEVAERIGFEEEFIESAKKYLDGKKSKIEELLIDLENKSQEIRKKLNQAEIENVRLKGLTNLYENKIAKLEKQKKEILKKTAEQAEDYLSDVNKKIEKAIKNIKESKAERKVIKEEKKEIDNLKKDLKKIAAASEEKIPSEKYKPKTGDYVQVAGTNTIGEILQLDYQKNKAIIASGSLKIQVKIDKLFPSKKPKSVSSPSYARIAGALPNYQLDIRGMRAEEAEFEVIKFLDEAYASGADRVEILHGKGTGALKQTVHQILKSHAQVKKFYFAKIEYGGDGITIVEMK